MPDTILFNPEEYGELLKTLRYFEFKENLDTSVIRKKEGYEVIFRLVPNSTFKYQFLRYPDYLSSIFLSGGGYQINSTQLSLPLDSTNFELVDTRLTMQIFQSSKQWVRLASWSLGDPYNQNLNAHVLYIPEAKEFQFATFTKSGKLITTKKLIPKLNLDHRYHITTGSRYISIFENKLIRDLQTGYELMDSTEILRYVVDTMGKLFTNNTSSLNPAAYCSSLPKDSIIDSRFDGSANDYPLPIDLERAIQNQFSIYYQLYNDYSYIQKTLFYSTVLIKSPTYTLFTIKSPIEQSWLILTDTKGELRDAVPGSNHMKLDPNNHVILQDFTTMDTLAIYRIENMVLVNTFNPRDTLPFPIIELSDFEKYFPHQNLRDIDPAKIELDSNGNFNFEQLPLPLADTIARLTGFSNAEIFQHPYNVLHTTNGLTYWIFYYMGSLSYDLLLFTIDQTGHLNPQPIQHYAGGDEGDTWYNRSKFTDDVTLQTTTITRSGDSYKDSTVSTTKFLPSGQFYIVPENYRTYRKLIPPEY